MRPIVLDTNVIVSAFRSSLGASHEIVLRLRRMEVDAVISVALLLEYEEVLLRERRALRLSISEVGSIVDALAALCRPVDTGISGRPRLHDPDDEIVLDAALAGSADAIVTHDLRHFAGVERHGVRAITPGQFLAENRP